MEVLKVEFEKVYVFPYAGKDESGNNVLGEVGESQILSVLGRLPTVDNYGELIEVAENKNLISWKKSLEYWRNNKVF